jgi:hypothetical protein
MRNSQSSKAYSSGKPDSKVPAYPWNIRVNAWPYWIEAAISPRGWRRMNQANLWTGLRTDR